jgi:hypothetical protein
MQQSRNKNTSPALFDFSSAEVLVEANSCDGINIDAE